MTRIIHQLQAGVEQAMVWMGLAVLNLALDMTAAPGASAKDWPQWCGSDGKNMVSEEKGLPELFSPGRKRSDKTIDLSTASNVK
jgi:hypothetical protein